MPRKDVHQVKASTSTVKIAGLLKKKITLQTIVEMAAMQQNFLQGTAGSASFKSGELIQVIEDNQTCYTTLMEDVTGHKNDKLTLGEQIDFIKENSQFWQELSEKINDFYEELQENAKSTDTTTYNNLTKAMLTHGILQLFHMDEYLPRELDPNLKKSSHAQLAGLGRIKRLSAKAGLRLIGLSWDKLQSATEAFAPLETSLAPWTRELLATLFEQSATASRSHSPTADSGVSTDHELEGQEAGLAASQTAGVTPEASARGGAAAPGRTETAQTRDTETRDTDPPSFFQTEAEPGETSHQADPSHDQPEDPSTHKP